MGRGAGSDKGAVEGPTRADAEKLAAFESLLARFESIGREVFPDGVWSCDGGAVVLNHLLTRAGIDNEIAIGLYHYSEEKLPYRYRMLYDVPADYAPSPEELDEVRGDTEHHHWVEVYSLGVRVDPNGEIRGEERVQPLTEEGAYQESHDPEVLQWSSLWEPESGDVFCASEAADDDPDVRKALALLSD